jgi:hypothetical protein
MGAISPINFYIVQIVFTSMKKTDKDVTAMLDGMFYGTTQDNRPGPNYTLRNQLTEDGGILKTHPELVESYIQAKRVDWNPGVRARARSFDSRIDSYRGKKPIYYNDISSPSTNWKQLAAESAAKYKVELIRQRVLVLALTTATLVGMFYGTSTLRDAFNNLDDFISNRNAGIEKMINQ